MKKKILIFVGEIYEDLDRRPLHLGLALFWFYVLMTLVILVGAKRRMLRGDSTG